MKVIIAGCRDIHDPEIVVESLKHAIPNTDDIGTIVSGKAPGVDTVGETVAKRLGIPVKEFPADWKKYNKAAGHIRNRQMADYADVLVAIWDGKSRGTGNMIATMTKLGKPHYVHMVEK